MHKVIVLVIASEGQTVSIEIPAGLDLKTLATEIYHLRVPPPTTIKNDQLRGSIAKLQDALSKSSLPGKNANLGKIFAASLETPIKIFVKDTMGAPSPTNTAVEITAVTTEGYWPRLTPQGNIQVTNMQEIGEPNYENNLVQFASILLEISNGTRSTHFTRDQADAAVSETALASHQDMKLRAQSLAQKPQQN